MSDSKKRILICVQAVDLDDPLMGFFVTWLQQAAPSFAHLTVLALRVGRYTLPDNVTVVPLRTRGAHSKVAVVVRVLKEAWIRRAAYDAVFVRGDPHYVLCAGWLWRLLGKKIVFWYTHYRTSRWAHWAGVITHVVVSSARAGAAGLPKLRIIGHGFESSRFPQVARSLPTEWKVLIFGRMDPCKRVKELLQAFGNVSPSLPFRLTLIGCSGDSGYEQILNPLVEADSRVSWEKRTVVYADVSDIFARHHIILNATDGSLDKTILEGGLSGLIPLASTDALNEWLPEDARWLQCPSEEAFVRALERISGLSEGEYKQLLRSIHEAVEVHHGSQAQIAKLVAIFQEV
jgi:glycosyltransferase involved in cell wall biosynthesis